MRLKSVFVYPIKSCGGVALERARVVERGLEHDRRYMLIDRSGRFVSQREQPRLCLVSATIEGSHFILSAPGLSALAIPAHLGEGARVECRVWNDAGHALCHERASLWFSEFLRDDVRLVYMPDSEVRSVNPQRAMPADIVSFADGYPLLVVSEASLADLNSRLEHTLDMRRFRPNLVVSECEPFAEDRVGTLTVGTLSLRAVKRCDRCVVTTVDPDNGERGQEPLRTLSRYRLEDGKVWFGMNLIHDGPGELRVGDAVTWT